MILPPRPLRTSRRYLNRWLVPGVFFLIAGLAFVALGAWLASGDAPAILEDQRLWASGIAPASASVFVSGKTSSYVFHDYSFRILFVDQNGVARTATRTCETLLVRPQSSGSPEVRYDPSQPDAAVVAWAVAAAPYRWLRVVVLFGFASVWFGPQLAFMSTKLLREFADVAACGRAGREIDLLVTEKDTISIKGIPVRRFKYRAKSPWGHEISGLTLVDPFLGAPLFLDGAESAILGLVSEHSAERAVVIRDSLLPYEFDAAGRARIEETLLRTRAERDRRERDRPRSPASRG